MVRGTLQRRRLICMCTHQLMLRQFLAHKCKQKPQRTWHPQRGKVPQWVSTVDAWIIQLMPPPDAASLAACRQSRSQLQSRDCMAAASCGSGTPPRLYRAVMLLELCPISCSITRCSTPMSTSAWATKCRQL